MSSENSVAAAENTASLISVIVPFYNTEAYFRKCLQALVGQTYKNIEILLIDDASTDGSLKIAEEFAVKDKRIRLLNQEMTPPLTDKIGVAKARNLGLDCARGKYIMFCDSDDWYEPNMVELMAKAMEENPDVELASCSEKSHQLHWVDKNMDNYLSNKTDGKLDFTQKRKYDEAVVLHNKILRSAIIAKYKIRACETISQSEDDTITAKYYAVSSKIFHIKSALYNYLMREDSLTHRGLQDQCNFGVAILKGLIDIADFFDKESLWDRNTDYFASKLRGALWVTPRNTEFTKEYERFHLFYSLYVSLAERVCIQKLIDSELLNFIFEVQHGYIDGRNMPNLMLKKLACKPMSNSVPIVFAVNDAYCRVLPVTLQSIIDNSSLDYVYNIILLTDRCSLEHLSVVQRQLENRHNFTLNIIPITCILGMYAKDLLPRGRFPQAMYGRFFIPEICSDFPKVIYAEADMIFNRDIADLMSVDLGENYIAAVQDIGIEVLFEQAEFHSYIKSCFGASYNTPYYNSGLLVVNTVAWRDNALTTLCIGVLKDKLHNTPYPDQDAINLICKGKVVSLGCEWNCCPFIDRLFIATGKMEKLIAARASIETFVRNYKTAIYSNTTCFHYAHMPKPWEGWSDIIDRYWWHYAKRTELYEAFLANFCGEKAASTQMPLAFRPKRATEITYYSIFGLPLWKVKRTKWGKRYCLGGLRLAKTVIEGDNVRFYILGVKCAIIRCRK